METTLTKLRGFFAGYKTYTFGGFLVLYAVAATLGVDVPAPGTQEEATGTVGVVVLILSALTNRAPKV